MKHSTAQQFAAWIQGSYYVTTGVWPLLHIRSFEAVTGPKLERWLVQTLGGLIAVVGATILREGVLARDSDREAANAGSRATVRLLACGSAGALATADIVFSSRGRISAVYLLDAAAQVALIALWLARRRSHTRLGAASRIP